MIIIIPWNDQHSDRQEGKQHKRENHLYIGIRPEAQYTQQQQLNHLKGTISVISSAPRCPEVPLKPQRIEYIERNLLEKSVKRPFCCTVSILQAYFTYLCYITFWALEYHYIENLKLLLKENQIMKQAGSIIDQ